MLKAQDVVQIALVDVGVLILFLALRLFKQLKVDFHALTNSVVRDWPSSDDSIVYFSLLYSYDEMFAAMSNPLLEIVEKLLSILAEVNVDSFCLGLQDSILIHQDEPHSY